MHIAQALVILFHRHDNHVMIAYKIYYNMNPEAFAILILYGKCCIVRKKDAAILLQIEYYPKLAISNGFKISKPQAWAEKIYSTFVSPNDLKLNMLKSVRCPFDQCWSGYFNSLPLNIH